MNMFTLCFVNSLNNKTKEEYKLFPIVFLLSYQHFRLSLHGDYSSESLVNARDSQIVFLVHNQQSLYELH